MGLAGLGTIDAVVLDGPPEGPLDFERQIVENSLRESLAPLDQARAFEALRTYHGGSARRLARELRVSHTTVHRALALRASRTAPGRRRGRPARPSHRPRGAANPPSASCSSSRATDVAPGPAGDGGRRVPTPRRVFPTRGGRVVVERDHPGDRVSILEAMREACELLKVEARPAPAPSPVLSLSEFLQKMYLS